MVIERIADGSIYPRTVFDTKGRLVVVRQSRFSGQWHRATLNVSRQQLAEWQNGVPIQDAMPNLSDDEREFLMTGITPLEWIAEFH